MARVRRDFKDNGAPTPCHGLVVSHQIRLAKNLALKHLKRYCFLKGAVAWEMGRFLRKMAHKRDIDIKKKKSSEETLESLKGFQFYWSPFPKKRCINSKISTKISKRIELGT